MYIFKGASLLLFVFSLLPVCVVAKDSDRSPQVAAAFTTLEEGLQTSLEPNGLGFDAARRLISLDAWSILDETELQRIANHEGAPVDVAWTMAARWYFDPEKQTPWLKKLQTIAISESQEESSAALRALIQLGAALPNRWPDDTEYSVSEENANVKTVVADASTESDDAAWLTKLRDWQADHDSQQGAYALTLSSFLDLTPEQQQELVDALFERFKSSEVQSRRAAAWSLRFLPRGQDELATRILRLLDQEADEVTRIELAAALIVHAQSETQYDQGMKVLTKSSDASEHSLLAQLYHVELIGRFGLDEDLPWLQTQEQHWGPSSRIALAAAEGVIHIQRRQLRSLGWLDWFVIGIYGVGMILIGWYYSRRTASTEDYLLGGRKMSPVMVGLSMFASLLSTLTFLAQPGEVIRNGPMTLVQVVSYPFVFLVVGWLLIPSIMRMRVTSGYEMLEAKLGLSTRLLGAMIFLTLRVLWMATIIYVTTSAVLIPMLGWPQSMTPVVCAAIGIVTIIYTSMGGLRAVVVTDATQTLILFGGALLAILLISIDMGGVEPWWPKKWYPQWQQPEWWDPSVRTSFVGLFLAMFSWQVCTTGSDQMAIQRFAATRDAAAARRVLWVSLATSGIVFAFLVCLGLALLAYFQSHPEYIPEQQRLFGDSDKMLPAFIIRRMPAGISGLVIAGLLAAAMSSLSSGVNSSCSVVTTDLIDRCRTEKLPEKAHIRIAKWVSVLLGVLVVALSLFVSVVPGNIFELCFKIANLLVGPLFLLFFLAIFVRRTNALSAWIGVLSGTAVAIAIGFGEQIFGVTPVSFVWLTPASFVGGLIPAILIGRFARSVESRALEQ